MNMLTVHPHCLMFFSDETGHEPDPNYPVFGFAGCAAFAAAIDQQIRESWRNLKQNHFGSADIPLHAADIGDATPEQMNAIGEFFRKQRFGRFAVTAAAGSQFPPNMRPFNVFPDALRRQWQESRSPIDQVEMAFIHEASERGDPLRKIVSERLSCKLMGFESQSSRNDTKDWR